MIKSLFRKNKPEEEILNEALEKYFLKMLNDFQNLTQEQKLELLKQIAHHNLTNKKKN